MKRFGLICKTEFILFIRDFFCCFFTLVFPPLLLLLFGGIYGNGPIYPGAELGMMDVSVPAYATMVMGVTGLMSFPLTLSGYKEKKIYKRFDATPVGKKSILAAQVIINVAMTFIGLLLLVIVGKLVFQIKIPGAFPGILGAALLSILTMFSMGFLFTAIGKDAKATNVLCYLFYFVMLFLSGATMPDILFPDTIKKISAVLPMTHAVDLMQGAFAGDALSLHTKEVAILGLFTAVFAIAGGLLYRKKDWT